jgi:hypothetical protein
MTPNLTKLAPSLSAEERYKIVMSDLLAQLDGEPAKISESELKAMLWFESKPMWREYALRTAMMRHASEIWIIEIEKEKVRSYAFYLHLVYQFEQVVRDVDIPKEKKMKRFDILKKAVSDLHHALEGFYAYREAIPKLEAVLYGIPFFSKATQASIALWFGLIESTIRDYNGMVRELSACHDAKRFIKPITEDMESYLVKDAVPSEMAVDELVDFIKKTAEFEVRSRD